MGESISSTDEEPVESAVVADFSLLSVGKIEDQTRSEDSKSMTMMTLPVRPIRRPDLKQIFCQKDRLKPEPAPPLTPLECTRIDRSVSNSQ